MTAAATIAINATPTRSRYREAFRDYVDARIATYSKLPDLAAARQESARAQQLQSQI